MKNSGGCEAGQAREAVGSLAPPAADFVGLALFFILYELVGSLAPPAAANE